MANTKYGKISAGLNKGASTVSKKVASIAREIKSRKKEDARLVNEIMDDYKTTRDVALRGALKEAPGSAKADIWLRNIEKANKKASPKKAVTDMKMKKTSTPITKTKKK